MSTDTVTAEATATVVQTTTTTEVTVTAAHTQRQTLTLLEFYPAHAPREEDPHYPIFNAARKKLEQLGKLVCWRCGVKEKIELHHSLVEFALANGVDVTRFVELYPEFDVTDEDAFLSWVESEGNLMPLCVSCHRGEQGIHSVTYPSWVAGRFWQKDLPAPAVVQRKAKRVKK